MGEPTSIFNIYAGTGGIVAVLGGWFWVKASIDQHMSLCKLDDPKSIKINKLPESIRKKSITDYSQSQLLQEFCDSNMIDKIGDITGEFSKVVTDNGLISADRIRTEFDPDAITIKKHGRFHYKEDSQRILVTEKNLREDLIKGLLMYFASREDEKQYGCGFRRIMKDHSYDFGRGLTNAYRDLLYNRYFTEDKDRPGNLFPDLAHLIEFIVGKNEMEKMFFESDLQGLIEKLSEFSTTQNVVGTIGRMDHLEKALIEHNNVLLTLLSRSTYDEIAELIGKMYSDWVAKKESVTLLDSYTGRIKLTDLANLKYSSYGIAMKPYKDTSIDMLEDYQSSLDQRFGFKRP